MKRNRIYQRGNHRFMTGPGIRKRARIPVPVHMMTGVLLVLASLPVSCDRTRSSTGWDYAPDMYYSEAYETYTPNEAFENGMTMRTPVEGTVPRGMVPVSFEKTLEDRERTGMEYTNPLEATEEVIRSGEDGYRVFCATCHGDKGDGKGYLYTSDRYTYPPASLVNERVKELSEGEIYHSITIGYGVMGAHGAMIRQTDRWKIIHYLREELQQ